MNRRGFLKLLSLAPVAGLAAVSGARNKNQCPTPWCKFACDRNCMGYKVHINY